MSRPRPPPGEERPFVGRGSGTTAHTRRMRAARGALVRWSRKESKAEGAGCLSKTARAKWIDGSHFSTELPSGHWLDLDGEDGQDLGPRPKELLLGAVCGCTGMDVVAILQKKRAAFDHFELSAEGTEAEDYPRIYQELLVTYTLNAPEETRPAFERAVELSWTKYCPVIATMRGVGRVRRRLVFNGVQGEITE